MTKHRGSGFAGTDLDMILRANGIDTLVLCGITTGGVVLSPVRHAADADRRLVIVEDSASAPRKPFEDHRERTSLGRSTVAN